MGLFVPSSSALWLVNVNLCIFCIFCIFRYLLSTYVSVSIQYLLQIKILQCVLFRPFCDSFSLFIKRWLDHEEGTFLQITRFETAVTCMLEAGKRWAWILQRPRRSNYFQVRLILTLLFRELKWHSTSSVHIGWIWKTLESEPSAKQFYLSNESRRLPRVIQSNNALNGTGTDPINTSRQKQEETAADSTPWITLLLGHRSAIGIRSNQIGLAHIHNWSSRQVLIFCTKNEYAPKEAFCMYLYVLRICTSMNAAKVAVSMVLPDRHRQALSSMKVTRTL